MGLEYGPTFASVRAAWRRGDEVFTEVCLPEAEHRRASQFNIHPALLDCSLQGMAVMMQSENPATPEYARLPFAWTRVCLHASGMSFLRVRISQLRAGGYSVAATDEHGRAVLSADSMVTRPFTQDARLRIHGVDSHSLLQLDWVAASASEIPATVSPQSWATLTGQESADAGEPSTGPDSAGDGAGQMVFCDLRSMIDAIDGGAPVPEVVLARFEADELAHQELPSASRRILERALSLVQEWLAEARLASSRLVLVTKRAVSAGKHDDVIDLVVAPLWGLLRSVQSEHPGRFVLVDTDESEDEVDALASALDTGEPQLALRAGELRAPRLKRVAAEQGELAVRTQAAERQSDPGDTVRSVADMDLTASGQRGSVLITGGTGLIGAALAKHLVGTHGINSVVLASRRGAEAPGAESLLAELIELGARASIVACDVSDREQLAQLIGSAPSEYPWSAIVHAAGDLDDGMVDAMTAERIDRTLSPKLDAAWHLHELTSELDLSAFILFSSSSGTFGSPGQGNYAAANAFLDALAAHRRERSLPGVSMAWGLWAEPAEMASDLTAADRARIERAGNLALSTEEGLSLFDVAYTVDKPLLIPARLNTAVLRAQARAGVVAPILKDLFRAPAQEPTKSGRDLLARRLASTPEGERKRVALDLVRAEVAAVLGHPSPDTIDATRAFKELGFDSLTAVELRNRLAFASGIQLPATLAFDYPSSAALSDFLLEQISPGIGQSLENGHREADVRDAFASIPLARLREAGVMDTLMQLAGLEDASAVPVEEDPAEQVDELDVASLVQLSLGSHEAIDEPGEGS